jgi:thiamine monophosphate kinase
MTLEEIIERYPDTEILKADGFDDAVIGIEERSGRLVYDVDMMIHILIKDEEMSEEDAIEYLDYNVIGAYVGEQTPIYITT